MSYRILSLDGGGIRGLVTTVLLERAVAAHPTLLAQVDLYAGTSIGGMLALGLAAGIDVGDFRQAFLEQGGPILLDSARPPHLQDAADYSNHNLKKFLSGMFGDMRMGDLPFHVLVTAYNLDSKRTNPTQLRRAKPKIFHNFDDNTGDLNVRVVDVAMSTAAVPVVFPIYRGHVDGGAFAVNPSMCAVAQALDRGTGGQSLADVIVLSVSTGRSPDYIDVEDSGDWGWEQWSVEYRIMSTLMGNDREVVNYQCERLLGERYHRIDPILPNVVRLNDVFSIPQLLMTAMQAELSDSIGWLQAHFE